MGCAGFAPGRSFAAGGLPGRFAGPFAGWLPGFATVAVAGLPGGACLTGGRAGAAALFAGRNCCISCRAIGCPGCAASACCLAAKGTGGGGAFAFATIARLATAAGGAVTRFAVLAWDPSTLLEVGATAALEFIGAEAISLALTLTAARATGCPLAKERWGTAVTAPETPLFTYVTLLMVLVLLTMVVL